MTKHEFITKWNVAFEDKEQEVEFYNEMNNDLDSLNTPTLRDQFAMSALTGLLADGDYVHVPMASIQTYETELSKYAYKLADAMLTQRKENNATD